MNGWGGCSWHLKLAGAAGATGFARAPGVREHWRSRWRSGVVSYMSKLPERSATSPSQRGARNQQVARAGEYFVAAELNKRRAFAVTFAGNMPRIDIIACNEDQSRTVHIQVKTKRGGRNWHSSIVGSQAMEPPEDETNFWIFVDLGGVNECPRFWIVPDYWIRDNIYKTHQAYLDRHGGSRARNPNSTHHSIHERRLEAWRDRWDILGIFG
jgi:hypothetical protein